MKRRTILKRAGATAAVGIGVSGTATASGGSPERIDVSDVSGRVEATELVEDPESTFEGWPTAPEDLRIVVDEDTEEITTQDIGCDLGCCCNNLRCPAECDSCFCSVCGPGACEPTVA